MRFLFALTLVILLQGCWTHWLVDGEVRLQLENRTDVAVADLVVLSVDGKTTIWIPDTLAPGSSSEVHAGQWVGNFRLGLSFRDSVNALGDSCWRFVDLGGYALEGGSSLALVRLSDGIGSLQLK